MTSIIYLFLKLIHQDGNSTNIQYKYFNMCNKIKFSQSQFKIFKKELHLPSPFTKIGDLFWPDFPRFRFFCLSGGCKSEGLV